MSGSDSPSPRLARPRNSQRAAFSIGLFAFALVMMGSTCVVVEEEGPPLYEEPGIVVPQNNAERMEEQEQAIIADEDR